MKSEQVKTEVADGKVIETTTGTWEAVTKDAEGNAHIHTLHKRSEKVLPAIDIEEIGRLLIRQAPPVIIKPSKIPKATFGDVVVFIPDAQIPFHDENAVRLAQLAIRILQPTDVVYLGDMLDFPTLSKYQARPEWAGKIQQSIDTYGEMLATTKANAPEARIHALTGNHEARMEKSIIRNNSELLGLKRANVDELPVMSLEYLLRCEELGVNWIEGYPNGTLWLSDKLRATHGTFHGKNVGKHLDENPYASVVHGHNHKAYIEFRTTPTQGGSVTRFTMSPGTLARVDGATPSNSTTTHPSGYNIPKAANWQQAVGIVQGEVPSLAMIIGNKINIFGKVYKS